MKLIRFGEVGSELPGVLLEDGTRRDCSRHFADWNRIFFNDGGLAALAKLLAAKGGSLPVVDASVRWAAPVARPGKVLGIGLNYSDHAAESGMAVPTEPVLFTKAANCVVGPYDDVLIPPGSTKTDWEVELGVVIGRDARHLADEAEAAEHVAGYTISNDVSERQYQLESGGQWVKGKSYDTFNPLGPFLATQDEIADPQDLTMSLSVNGLRRQQGNTRTMIFPAMFLVKYLSRFMTLEAGDLITTGTPPGVGLGMKPPTYLKHGDVVELEIAGLGRQRQVFRDDTPQGR